MWSVLCRADVAIFERDVMSWLDSLEPGDQTDVDIDVLERSIDRIIEKKETINPQLSVNNFKALHKIVRANKLEVKGMEKRDIFRKYDGHEL